jgi:hypothetical protein
LAGSAVSSEKHRCAYPPARGGEVLDLAELVHRLDEAGAVEL